MNLGFDERDRESVLRDLVSQDEEVRRLAVERADALASEELVSHLIERLGDLSWRVRKAAVERIVASAEPLHAVGALVEALSDGENPGRRNAAVEALVACGSAAVPQLIEATGSDDVDVRKFAVDALGGIADPAATDELIAVLEDPDPNVCAAAADALGALGGETAAHALCGVATSDARDPLVRFSALHALVALDVPLRVRDMTSVFDDPILRVAGLELLGRVADDVEGEALLLKALSEGPRTHREAAMRSLLRLLARLDDAAADRLTRELRELSRSCPELVESSAARLESAPLPLQLVLAQFLGLLAAPGAVIPMLRVAHDEAVAHVALSALADMGAEAECVVHAAWGSLDAATLRSACELLGRTEGERGADCLMSALGSPAPELRVAAARALGRRRFAGAVEGLVQRLEAAACDDDFEAEEEREAVAGALISMATAHDGSSPEPVSAARAIALLRARLEGADERVRVAFAAVLGCICRPEDSELITFLLKDASARVRRAAVDALARIDPGIAPEPLHLAIADESPSVRIAAAAALGNSPADGVFEDLRRLARDEEPRVRATAVRAIGLRFSSSGDSPRQAEALDVLQDAFGDDAPIALAAVEALRQVGGAAVARCTVLLQRAEPELVHEVVRCLGAHGEEGDLDALIPLVGHPDWAVRAEAIQMLSDRRVAKAVPAILRRLETEQDDFVRKVILRALERLES